MEMVPRGSLADRREWSRAHPWLAGCYFGVLISVVLGVLIALVRSPAVGFAFFVVMWPASAVAMAILIKRRP